jgi:replication factor C small subunit
MEEVWIEKYRPKSLSDVVGQTEIVERLQAYVRSKSMPHLLFSGRPGTGKTTCAIALVREFFGEDWRLNFQELNASDERGIDVVRHKIKDFARMAPIGSDFKVIFPGSPEADHGDVHSHLPVHPQLQLLLQDHRAHTEQDGRLLLQAPSPRGRQ